MQELALMKEYDVCPEAWEPFAERNHGIFTHPILKKIGEKYVKSAAQAALRWNVQRGGVVIPKSVHKERMEQNGASVKYRSAIILWTIYFLSLIFALEL